MGEIEHQIREALGPLRGRRTLYEKVCDALEPVLRKIVENREHPISVVCDESNNTPESVAQGELHVTLKFDFSKATEHEKEFWLRLQEDQESCGTASEGE